MRRILFVIITAIVLLSGCSTAGRTSRTDVNEARLSERQSGVTKSRAVELDLSALFLSGHAGRNVTINRGALELITGNDGIIAFNMPDADTLLITPEPCPGPDSPCTVAVPVSGWLPPYRYAVLPDGSVKRKSPWVEFRRMPGEVTHQPQFDFLCRSEYPALVKINGTELKQYKTGIFFTTVRFNEGINRVKAEAVYPDGSTASHEMEFVYEKRDPGRQPFPLWIEERSFEPAADMELLPGEVVKVSFSASRGQEAWIDIRPGRKSLKCIREDFDDYSLYRAEISLRDFPAGPAHTLSARLIPAAGSPVKDVYRPDFTRSIIVRNPEDFPLVRIKNEHSRLVYNLGAPRLGGPVRSETGPGIVLKTCGKIGSSYRIRLSRTETGFVDEGDTELVTGSREQPVYSVTSMSCAPSVRGDVITIPWLEPVPYEVFPDPGGKRLVVTVFGAESAATWVSHRAGCRVVDRLTWEQTTPETFRVYVNLKTENIWGYDIRTEGKNLVLVMRYPPVVNPAGEKPLKGLKIAIEAGHGGTGLGAVGLSGLLEKDINLDLSFMLGDLCAGMGAEVVQIRDRDMDMTLIEKRDKAIKAAADMLISIHANAGGRGYLSVAGTSTYWHNPFWAPLAETIYNRLLETGLGEFGVVGSFNYTAIRMTQMPAVLVEQAFMSHAEDEEKLADPDFRRQMALKILDGIIDYLKLMKE